MSNCSTCPSTSQGLQWGATVELNGWYLQASHVAETIFWGVFTTLFIFSVYRWSLRDVPHNQEKLLLIALCVTVYGVATTHWALNAKWSSSAPNGVDGTLLDCVSSARGNYTSRQPAELIGPIQSPISKHSQLIMLLLAVNAVLSNASVLFAACTTWAKKRAIHTVSAAFFLGLLASTGYAMYTFGSTASSSTECSSSCRRSVIAAIIVATSSNLWATLIIGYKTWLYRRAHKAHNFSSENAQKSPPQKGLVIFISSGLFNCVLWVVIAVSSLVCFTSALAFGGGTLIQLVGIYPTILAVLPFFEKLQNSKTASAELAQDCTRGVRIHIDTVINIVVDPKGSARAFKAGDLN